jgi:hypothetical protein
MNILLGILGLFACIFLFILSIISASNSIIKLMNERNK